MKSIFIPAALLAASLTASAIDVPAGAELSAFLSENFPPGSTDYITLSLEPGATYELTDTADFRTVYAIISGSNEQAPCVKVSGNGCILLQNSLNLNYVDFDMTEARNSSFILMNSNPDPAFSTEALGLKEQGATLDGYVADNITITRCNFRNMPGSIISNNDTPWALKNLRIQDCVLQFNKKSKDPAIDFASDNEHGFGLIGWLYFTNSTFYNTGTVKDSDFISYNPKVTEVSKVFGNGSDIGLSLSYNTFSNLCPGGKFLSYVQNNDLSYNISYNILNNVGTLETYTDYIHSSRTNIIWHTDKELTLTAQQERFLYVANPDFVGPTDREFNLNEPKGGVDFRPRNSYCETRGSGDPRWYPQPITIPDGTDLSKFIPENILDGSLYQHTFGLEYGATYFITDSIDCKLASVDIRGVNASSSNPGRPTVSVSGNGCFIIQNGLQIREINFDMTDASAESGSSFIKLAYEPDSCFSTKYNGLREQFGESIMDGFVMDNPIYINYCNFRNIPGSIITNNHAAWALKLFGIYDCVVQFNKRNEDAAINFYTYKGTDWSNFSQILGLTLLNSTFYNTSGDVKARFIWYLNKKSAQPENAFGPYASSWHSIGNCTFSKTFTGNQFANNMPETDKFTVSLNNNIFYDIQRVDQYCCRANQQLQADNNISWLAGTEAELSPNVEKFSTIADPDFVGPIDLPFDLSDEFGGVNFRPMNPICKENRIGDPRWYYALPRVIVVPDGSELSAFMAENVPDGYSGDVTPIKLEEGGSYSLVADGDCKLSDVLLFSDSDNHPTIKVTGEGAFVTQNGLTIKNVDIDMTDAPLTALIKFSAQPDASLALPELRSGATCYVCNNTIALESCNISNLPGSIITQNNECWALRNFRIDDCVVQFNKSNSQPAIDFDDRWEFGCIKDMTLKNSTFYNTGEVNNCYFIRYGMRSNRRISDAFGEWADSRHNIDNCTFYKTFDARHFANNMPERADMSVTINSSIFYDISRLDNYFSRNGLINHYSDNNNMAWLGGTEDGVALPVRREVEEISYVEDPDFVGPCNLPYNLNETYGGVSFRPQNVTAIDNKIGDPRWFDDPSSIRDIQAEPEEINDAPAEYFNLQGIRISADRLIPGIYVKRQGTKTTKVLVK